MPINLDEITIQTIKEQRYCRTQKFYEIKRHYQNVKEWGEEYVLPTGSLYTVKYMIVKPGASCSVHFHQNKEECFTLVQGKLELTYWDKYGNSTLFLMYKPLDSVILGNLTPHTFTVPEDQEYDTIFIESSTPDSSGDSYRLTKSHDPNISNR